MKPKKGLKRVGYYTSTKNEVGPGKHYKSWRYYIWTQKGWKQISHADWLMVLQMLTYSFSLEFEQIVVTEEYELV